jgi:hypothetical protein
MLELQKKYIDNEVFELLHDARACIGPMIRSPWLLLVGQAPISPPSSRAHHWVTPTFHSSHNTQAALHTINSQAKSEQLKLSKTDPST